MGILSCLCGFGAVTLAKHPRGAPAQQLEEQHAQPASPCKEDCPPPLAASHVLIEKKASAHGYKCTSHHGMKRGHGFSARARNEVRSSCAWILLHRALMKLFVPCA